MKTNYTAGPRATIHDDQAVERIGLSMRKFALLVTMGLLAFGLVTCGATPPDTNPKTRYEYTSLLARPLNSSATPVLGTDGKYHIAYELFFQNASRRLPATLTGVDVLTGDDHSRVIASMTNETLAEHLFSTSAIPAKNTTIERDAGRLLAINLIFDSIADIPNTLTHKISALAAANPGSSEPSPVAFTIAPYAVTAPQKLKLGPPLKGNGWVAVNGCCKLGFPHRMSVLPINGALVNSQRFAIDWMRINANGRLVSGPLDNAKSWTGYGAQVYAVADGTIVKVTNDLDDQVPGTLPDPTTMTMESVDGNGVVIDLGNSRYVFYAHMQKGSVSVKVGDKVKRGDKIGLLGNSGNTSAPHLHLHVMNGRSPLGSDGFPYLIDGFELAGQLDREAFINSKDLSDDFGGGRTKTPRPLHNRYPLQLNIVNFPN